MHPIETTIYVLLTFALLLSNIWHMLGVHDDQAAGLGFMGLAVLALVAFARYVWVSTAHSREMKRIRKEINKTKW